MIVGVISNFDERLESILASTKLLPYFSFVVTSYSHGVEKPNVSIFEEALRLASHKHGIDIAPEEAIHIGDTLLNDYIGAKNARWNAVIVNHQDHLIDENKIPRADCFKNLAQLQIYFQNVLE